MPAYTITLVSQDQIPGPTGDLVDVYDITFTIDGRSGSFTAQSVLTGDPVANAANAVQAITDEINAIYGLG